MRKYQLPIIILLFSMNILATGVSVADVNKGVEAWARGDYEAAVKEWHDPAINGDVDAQFNLGQAYTSGRGVEVNLGKAEIWFGLAANGGHLQAIKNYGLILFKNDRRKEAMPYLKKSAERGEPRAQYIVGTALFNGNLLEKDYVRAYAFMSHAAAAGLPQAIESLKTMDEFLPEAEKEAALLLAENMKLEFR